MVLFPGASVAYPLALPPLGGFGLQVQALSLSTGQNPAGVLTSNAITLHIGS